MHKGDLVAAVAKTLGETKVTVEKVLNTILAEVKKELKSGKGSKVTLVGFGTFETVTRAAREGRNPQTGAKIKIKASKTVKFKPGKELKDEVNK